ncbi:hypothetical protein ACP70R_015570 [Stipagrostis hirtigluma subsp. patula]
MYLGSERDIGKESIYDERAHEEFRRRMLRGCPA